MKKEKIDKAILTKEQAKKMILVNDEGMVHTFYNVNGVLIGGDHSKKSILKDIENAFECRKGGKHAKAMKHELVIIPTKEWLHKNLLFVETKEELK